MSESEQEAEPEGESEAEAEAATDAAGEHTGAEETGEHASQKTGRRSECRRCGREEGLVSKYGVFVCRQCFREIARDMGFKKYR